jgi:isoleucyl-tRNA synthetase
VSTIFNGNFYPVNESKMVLLEEGGKKIPYFVEQEIIGSALIGIKYEQLLPFAQPAENSENAFKVIPGSFVTTDDGTGIVHIAPTFGQDDALVAKEANVPAMLVIDKLGNKVPLVDLQGKFRPEMGKYAGKYVKNEFYSKEEIPEKSIDVEIAIQLKEENKAFSVAKYEHSYPHCWRTDKPILYYPLDSWFIKVTQEKEKFIALNKKINWKPKSTGTGRFGNWLENANDWNLSRSRFWGTPIPIWRSEDGTEEICISSIEQLKNECEKAVTSGFMEKNPLSEFIIGDMTEKNYSVVDLHKNYVDEITLVSESGKPMKRESDLIDVWFDSGSMPYAQWHYPFENKELIDGLKTYPADFIAEGVDQTRGWFYTLHAISAMCFNSEAYKNVVSNGLVLDKSGQKMSKRVGNVVDPFETLEKYGPDATRWYMLTNAQPWDNLRFNLDGITEVQRKFFGTLYNTYGFFALYANLDEFQYNEKEIPLNDRPEIDRWILSKLNSLIKNVDHSFENYEPTKAGRFIQLFVIDQLSNWYVRLCRRRFWKGEFTNDKLSAYQTLYTCLEAIARLSSPIAPFFSDRLFRDLISVTKKHKVKSVHLSSFPKYNTEIINLDLEERMEIAQRVCSLVLGLRKKEKIKVRQPLQKIMVPAINENFKKQLISVKSLILSELNVKELEVLTSDSNVIKKKVKPNFKTIGPKYGKHMKAISSMINAWGDDEINTLENKKSWSGVVNGDEIELLFSDFEIQTADVPGFLVSSDNDITVALDIQITDELINEGIARDFVNRIQNLRKDYGFNVTDRINIRIMSNNKINRAINNNLNYICSETLAESLEIVNTISDKPVDMELGNGLLAECSISKIN